MAKAFKVVAYVSAMLTLASVAAIVFALSTFVVVSIADGIGLIEEEQCYD